MGLPPFAEPQADDECAGEPGGWVQANGLGGITPGAGGDGEVLHRQPQLLLVLLEALAQRFAVLRASHGRSPSAAGVRRRGGCRLRAGSPRRAPPASPARRGAAPALRTRL